MIKISVVVPVYNVELYISEFVQSLNQQTLKKDQFEIIFVDDCSDDTSCEKIVASVDPTLNYSLIQLSTPSRAPGKPRNIGIEKATAPYIVFYDPDDLIPNYALETKLNLITAYDSEVLTGMFTRFATREKYLLGHDFGESSVCSELNVDVSGTAHGVDSTPAIWSRIFSRNFLVSNELRFLEGVIAQDASFMFDVFNHAKKLSFVPIVFCHYRIRQEPDSPSITQSLDPKYFSDFLTTRTYMYNQNPALYKQRKAKDLRVVLMLLSRSTVSLDDLAPSMKKIHEFFSHIDMRLSDISGPGRKLAALCVRFNLPRIYLLLHRISLVR